MIKSLLFCLALLLLTPVSIYAADLYSFPWSRGSSAWAWTTGWHSASYYGGRALDFAPGSDRRILAARNGVIIRMCRGLRSRNIAVKQLDGKISEYWHIGKDSIPLNVKPYTRVLSGQVLGTTSGAHRFDGCGISTGHHVHWVLPSPSKFDIQNYSLSTVHSKLTDGMASRYVGQYLKSSTIPNKGQLIDCWEGPNVNLFGKYFNIPTDHYISCYGSNSLSTHHNVRVNSGAKLILKSSGRVVINEGFRATTIGKGNLNTYLQIKIGGIF